MMVAGQGSWQWNRSQLLSFSEDHFKSRLHSSTLKRSGPLQSKNGFILRERTQRLSIFLGPLRSSSPS